MIEENKNSDIKPIMSALEHWDELQKYGKKILSSILNLHLQ